MTRPALRRVFLLALMMLCFTILAAQTGSDSLAVKRASPGALSLGVGIPYGGLGFCGELNLSPNLALTAGLGTMLVQSGYNAGIKATLLSPTRTLRPSLTLVYGVNGSITARDDSLPHITEAMHGWSGGFGAQMMFGKKLNHGLELRLMYNITTPMPDRIEELEAQGYGPFTRGSRFAYAMGYRYAF